MKRFFGACFSALPAVALVGACNTGQPPAPSASQAPTSWTPQSDAVAAMPTASAVAPLPEGIEVFLEAARTDIKKPYARAPLGQGRALTLDEQDRTADRMYAEAAAALLGGQVFSTVAAGETVARVLSRTSDPRGPQALAEWAITPTTNRMHLTYALSAMADQPRPEYLAVAKAILGSNDFADQYERRLNVGLYSDAVGAPALGSTWTLALYIASKIGNDDARSFLREVAMDRTRAIADPRVVKILVCCNGKRIEDEARALATVRLVALGLLKDKALAHAVAEDKTEPPFIRKWAGIMEKGENARARARHAMGVHGQWSVSPCPPDPEGPCLGP